MRIVLALAITLALAGCTNLTRLGELLPLATASVANPVTPKMLYEVENGAVVAFAGLNAYKRACVSKAIPQSCRSVIKSMQVYTRQIPPLLDDLRDFVRKNDQVNASTVYNTVLNLFSSAQQIAAANNVNMGGK